MSVGAIEESLIIGCEVAWAFVKASVILVMKLSSMESVMGFCG